MAFAGRTGASGRSQAWHGQPAVHRTTGDWPAFAANDDDTPRQFPEIDCIRTLLSADVLAAAEERAAKIGVGTDRVLIARGALSEETYLRALAQSIGTAFEPLDGIRRRAHCPIDDERLIESAAAGLLPLEIDGELCFVLSPRGVAARRIVHLAKLDPAWARRFRFTSGERLTRFILRAAPARRSQPAPPSASSRSGQSFPPRRRRGSALSWLRPRSPVCSASPLRFSRQRRRPWPLN